MSEVGGWQADAEAAQERVQRQVTQAQENATRAARLRRRLDRLRAQDRSPHGEVVAETDATGRLVDLRIAPNALALNPDELSALILQTVDGARSRAEAEAVELAARALGAESPALPVLAAELRRPVPTDR